MAVSRIGQRVGPFELAERIEGDGTATLYRAIRPAGSREPRVVAVRMADDPRDERAAAWIRNEYDILRALSEPPHPALPRPYGYYASRVAVAIEDIDGVSIAEALQLRHEGRVPVDAATVLEILVELAQALRHAHSTTGPQGPIVHGHITPDLVHLTRDGQVKLLGFGREATRRAPAYTPPEQAAGAFQDARSDQWAVASLGLELLLGQPVYSGADDPMALALNGRVGPWLDRLERRWPEVCRVFARCLAPAAGDRYAREADLVRDLLAASRTLGGRADVRALAGRVAALLPQPAPITPPPAAAPAPAAAPTPPAPEGPGPTIQSGLEPKIDSTLVPLEDDVDPDSVRAAALHPPPDRDRTDDLDTTRNARVAVSPDRSGSHLPPSQPPILRDRRRLEDEVTDTVPGAMVETLPAETAQVQAGPAVSAPSTELDEPESDADTPIAGELPFAGDPGVAAVAVPVGGPTVAAGEDAPPDPDSHVDDPDDADAPEEDDLLTALGVSPLSSLDPAIDGGPGDEEPATDPGLDVGALPGDALRWTEMLAIVSIALLVVTGVSFLAWRFF